MRPIDADKLKERLMAKVSGFTYKTIHIADGWLYKRDCCKNGHAVDWAAYERRES